MMVEVFWDAIVVVWVWWQPGEIRSVGKGILHEIFCFLVCFKFPADITWIIAYSSFGLTKFRVYSSSPSFPDGINEFAGGCVFDYVVALFLF